MRAARDAIEADQRDILGNPEPGFLDRALTVFENADRPAMNAAARATYEATFGGERMNRDLIDLYESLVVEARQPKAAPVRHDQKSREQIAARNTP